jgi:hypothetical protein
MIASIMLFGVSVSASLHPENKVQPPGVKVGFARRLAKIDPRLVVTTLQTEPPIDVERTPTPAL